MPRSEQIQRSLIDLAKKKSDHDKRCAEAQTLQAKKGAEATSFRLRAGTTQSDSMRRSYLRQAEAADRAANDAARKSAEESRKSAACSEQQARGTKELAAALASEQQAAERKADSERREAARRADAQRREQERQEVSQRREHERQLQEERDRTDRLVSASEQRMVEALGAIRPPKVEVLRILYLTASSKGDLRVDEEIRRVKAAVRRTTHRDLVVIEHMPAATTSDLLDGLARFRPHVVHFSGHANEDALVFDTGSDLKNVGHAVSADGFRGAIASVDEPPTLVLLNACKSGAHLGGLLTAVPLAIGMTGSVGDRDAMAFAARFYSAVAEGQSIRGAFQMARAQLELDGLSDADLPVIEARPGVDAGEVVLVCPPA